MTRTGKIARLPRSLRTELNQRLQDGRPGPELLEWLNALPEVQAILAKDFEGNPISQQNLSLWKNGGYVVWEREQIALERLDAAYESSAAAESDPKGSLASRLSAMLVLEMAVELTRMDEMPSGPEKLAMHTQMIKNLWLLQRCDLAGAKRRLDEQKYRLGLQQEEDEARKIRKQHELEDMSFEERQERIRIILGTEQP